MFSFWPICTSSFFDKCYVWTNAYRIKLGPNFDSLTNPLVNCKKEEVIFPFFYCHRGRFCTRRWRREEHFYDSLRTNFTFKKVKQNYTRVLCATLGYFWFPNKCKTMNKQILIPQIRSYLSWAKNCWNYILWYFLEND